MFDVVVVSVSDDNNDNDGDGGEAAGMTTDDQTSSVIKLLLYQLYLDMTCCSHHLLLSFHITDEFVISTKFSNILFVSLKI